MGAMLVGVQKVNLPPSPPQTHIYIYIRVGKFDKTFLISVAVVDVKCVHDLLKKFDNL